MARVLILVTILASLGKRITWEIHIEPRNPRLPLFRPYPERGQWMGEREPGKTHYSNSKWSILWPSRGYFTPFKHFGRHFLNELLSWKKIADFRAVDLLKLYWNQPSFKLYIIIIIYSLYGIIFTFFCFCFARGNDYCKWNQFIKVLVSATFVSWLEC